MLTAAARTHVGRVRAGNEDALVCRPAEGLFAVVDGMGGEAAGEVAAAIAADTLASVPNTRRQSGEALLAAAFRTARSRILAEAARDPNHAKMGAVATAIRLDDDGRGLCIAHAGDTRAYRIDRAGVTQLTHDHVAETGAPGKKSAVTRDLGRSDLPEAWVDSLRVPVQRGDLVVLCTDGLYDPVSQAELATELTQLWSSKTSADEAANRLVGLALARGGPDNVTVVVIRIDRFRRRGGTMRRLGVPAAAAILGLMAALALVAGLWRDRNLPKIPTLVTRTTTVTEPALIVLDAPAPTEIRAGRALTLRGVRVSADTWTLTVGDGARLDLNLAAVVVEGALTIHLGTGASVVLDGARVSAGTLSVTGPGSVTCTDSLLRTEGGGWTPDPTITFTADGCRIGARADPDSQLFGAAPPATPAAPAEPVPAEPVPPAPAP